MMDDFKVGAKAKFKPHLVSGALRQRQAGTVIAVYDLPAQGGPTVDIQFDNGQVEHGIRTYQIERL